MKFRVKNESPWDLVDVMDSALHLLMLGTAVLMVIYGVVEGSQALWPWVA